MFTFHLRANDFGEIQSALPTLNMSKRYGRLGSLLLVRQAI